VIEAGESVETPLVKFGKQILLQKSKVPEVAETLL
jgi:hypothetical protein